MLDGVAVAVPCLRLAVYSGPFRGHQMTVLEIIIVSCILVKWMVCCPKCIHVTVVVNSVCAGKQCMHETYIQNFMHDIVRSLRCDIARSTNPRSLLQYRVIDMIPNRGN